MNISALKRFAAAIRSSPRVVVMMMALLLALGAYGASLSRVDNSLPVWQSADAPEWLAYQKFMERNKIIDPLILLVPEVLNLQQTIGVNDAFSSLSAVSKSRGITVQTVQEEKLSLFSIVPVPDASSAQLAEILSRIESILQEQGIKRFYAGGVWYLTKQLDELSARATTVLFPVVLLVVCLIVWLLSRKAAVLIVSCGLFPALLLVGFMGLCGVKMNMVLLALPPLTLILGLSHAIHFCIKQWGPGETVVSLFARVAPPCIFSALTTALGFASLRFSSYAPVRELGLWGAVGAVLSLMVTFLLIPAFLQPVQPSGKVVLPRRMASFISGNRKYIVLALILLLTLAASGISQLQKGSLILDFFTKKSEVRTNYHHIENAGIGLTPVEVDLFGHELSREKLEPSLHKLTEEFPGITHIFLQMENGMVQVDSLAAKMQIPELNIPGQKVQRITLLIYTISSEETLRIADAMEVFFQTRLEASTTPYITGSVPLYTRGQKQLFSSMLQSFSVAFFSISLLISLLLRSFRMGLVAMVPNLLPVLFVMAAMGWLGIPLSVATITVASIIFGIVVDDTIHMLYGFRKQSSSIPAVKRLDTVFQEVGAPIVTTTLVTGTGFLAFLASPFIPLAQFGLLISLALWMALLCDFFVLPVLLLQGETDV